MQTPCAAYCPTCHLPEKGHPDPRQAVMYDHTTCYAESFRRRTEELGRRYAERRNDLFLRIVLG